MREHAAPVLVADAATRYVTPDRLRELIAAHLDALEAIVRWNEQNEIQVFRLTSNLIPSRLMPPISFIGGRSSRAASTRSGHGGAAPERGSRRTPANTPCSPPRGGRGRRRGAELEYHAQLLASFGLDHSHKIVLHGRLRRLGSAGRPGALSAGFERLPAAARERLVLENDERWPLEQVLALAERIGVPVAFDVFHNDLAPSAGGLGVRELVVRAAATWRPGDGRQEVHFSTQEPGRRPGAHAESVDLDAFAAFVDEVGDLLLDCVLEVKDKEQSVLRARAFLRGRG